MQVAVYLFLIVGSLASNILLAKESPFSTIKSLLLEIYQSEPYTFFCHFPFTKTGYINFKGCSTCPVIKSEIKWISIVTPQHYAAHLNCYQHKICIRANGQTFKGLNCCEKMDSTYRQMRRDLHNFVPDIAIIKQQRKFYSFIANTEEAAIAQSENCSLQIDKKAKAIMLPASQRGMVARAYLYMRATYRIKLSEEEYHRYLTWHHQYPATHWEQLRNNKIALLQGRSNPYVSP